MSLLSQFPLNRTGVKTWPRQKGNKRKVQVRHRKGRKAKANAPPAQNRKKQRQKGKAKRSTAKGKAKRSAGSKPKKATAKGKAKAAAEIAGKAKGPLAEIAGKAKGPLVASGAALVVAVGGAAATAARPEKKVLGVKLPKQKRVKVRSKDLKKAAKSARKKLG